MASSDWWVKMRIGLDKEPEVIAVSQALGVEPDLVCGKLLKFWGWIKKVSRDGNVRGVTASWIDAELRLDGFAAALARERWLVLTPAGISVPNPEKHLTKAADRRALTADRAKAHRERKRNAPGVTGRAPEKRREEDIGNTPLPPALDTPEFRAAWRLFVRHRAEIRKPLKATQVGALLRRLAGWGAARAAAAVEHTVAQGWQGIREPEVRADGRARGGSSVGRPGRVEPPPGKYAGLGERLEVPPPPAPPPRPPGPPAGQGEGDGVDPGDIPF